MGFRLLCVAKKMHVRITSKKDITYDALITCKILILFEGEIRRVFSLARNRTGINDPARTTTNRITIVLMARWNGDAITRNFAHAFVPLLLLSVLPHLRKSYRSETYSAIRARSRSRHTKAGLPLVVEIWRVVYRRIPARLK